MLTKKALSATSASTGWNLANAVYDGSSFNFFSVVPQETNPRGLFFKGGGKKMYVLSRLTLGVWSYDL